MPGRTHIHTPFVLRYVCTSAFTDNNMVAIRDFIVVGCYTQKSYVISLRYRISHDATYRAPYVGITTITITYDITHEARRSWHYGVVVITTTVYHRQRHTRAVTDIGEKVKRMNNITRHKIVYASLVAMKRRHHERWHWRVSHITGSNGCRHIITTSSPALSRKG